MNLRTGKRSFQASPADFHFAEFVDMELVLKKAPTNFGHEIGIKDWGMLGNDMFGDCTCAGGCHEHMLWNHEAGRSVTFTDDDALGLYSAVTGFDPEDPSTDQGAYVRDVLSYRRKKGVKDQHGKLHKIDAYLLLERGNVDHLEAAAYVFGAVGCGFAFPNYAMGQFKKHKAWSVQPGDPHPNEGHYVPIVAKRNGFLKCVTWSALQSMTVDFWQQYADETWAIYSKEMLNARGLTPEGLDAKKLAAQLAALKGA